MARAAKNPRLKRCPFCGGKAVLIPGLGSVHCSACDAQGPWAPRREAIIAAWNTRKEKSPGAR